MLNGAIAVCDGDVRAALRAALIYNEFLECCRRTGDGPASGAWRRVFSWCLTPLCRSLRQSGKCSDGCGPAEQLHELVGLQSARQVELEEIWRQLLSALPGFDLLGLR